MRISVQWHREEEACLPFRSWRVSRVLRHRQHAIVLRHLPLGNRFLIDVSAAWQLQRLREIEGDRPAGSERGRSPPAVTSQRLAGALNVTT